MIDFEKTEIPTVVPTRTFLEKVFLLHEEFQKDYPRHKRMSRHLYDSLVEHRSIFNAIRGIDYSNHTPDKLSILPPGDLLPLWEEDYKAMQDRFHALG